MHPVATVLSLASSQKRAPVAMAHDVLRPDGRNASVPHSKPVAANTSVINAPRGNRAVYGTVAKRVAQDRPKMARKEKTKTKRIKTCIFLSFCFCCFLVVFCFIFVVFLVSCWRLVFFLCVPVTIENGKLLRFQREAKSKAAPSPFLHNAKMVPVRLLLYVCDLCHQWSVRPPATTWQRNQWWCHQKQPHIKAAVPTGLPHGIMGGLGGDEQDAIIPSGPQ